LLSQLFFDGGAAGTPRRSVGESRLDLLQCGNAGSRILEEGRRSRPEFERCGSQVPSSDIGRSR
jgi:hypothetical protein